MVKKSLMAVCAAATMRAVENLSQNSAGQRRACLNSQTNHCSTKQAGLSSKDGEASPVCVDISV